MGTKTGWTEQRRARQAEIIRMTQPWIKSTGPRTIEGKTVSSQNARTPEVFREIAERRKAIMSGALAILGRKSGTREKRGNS